MKRWLFLGLFLIASMANGQHLGKTCAEILKMGHDKWFEFYTDKEGSSTAAMVSASTVYGDCLSKQNQAQLKALGEADRNWIGSQFKLVRSITADLFSLEARGGGSMYLVISASDYVRGEDLLQKLIRIGKAKAVPTSAQQKKSTVLIKDSRKNFERLSRLLKTEPEVANPAGYKRKDFLKWAYDARAKYEKFLKALPPTRATANILMLEHIYDSLLPKNFATG